jgi:hypothetical protein
MIQETNMKERSIPIQLVKSLRLKIKKEVNTLYHEGS